MTYFAEQELPILLRWRPPPRDRHRVRKRKSIYCKDARWPAVAKALAALHGAKRRSVRIVDTDCGAGGLLLCAVRYARTLGFTAIEARGISHVEASIRRAQAAAANLHDPAIGISFEAAELVRALDDEEDLPADIIIWHGRAPHSNAESRAVANAGRALISDPPLDADVNT